MTRRWFVLIALATGCASKSKPPKKDAGTAGTDVGTTLPPAPPVPAVPAGLPKAPDFAGITPEAVALGELLFFDPRLSSSNRVACATCHEASRGFAGASTDDTATGKVNLRRALPLVNLAWTKEFGWDGRFTSLDEQLAAHLRGQLGDDLANAVTRISDVPGYRAHFARVGGVTTDVAMTALRAYVLTRYEGNAPWDRLERTANVPAEMKAGYQLFTGKAQCSVCHTPPLYTDQQYHRIGLIKTPDEGRGRVEPARIGAFKTPTLRGAAIRRAFFHDASQNTLDAAIDWHLDGGIGHGADPSIVDIKKIALAPQERAQLGAFVAALTDSMQPIHEPELP